jgi:hypothetical protein
VDAQAGCWSGSRALCRRGGLLRARPFDNHVAALGGHVMYQNGIAEWPITYEEHKGQIKNLQSRIEFLHYIQSRLCATIAQATGDRRWLETPDLP